MDKVVRPEVEYTLKRIYVDAFKDASILVIGGFGFLGSWLVDSMVMTGEKVAHVDNISSGSLGNIKHLSNDHGLYMAKHNHANDARNSILNSDVNNICE